MRIAVVCNDTRGGVQPYVALAQGLKRAGHEVRGVAPAEFAPMFAEIEVPLHPLSGGELAAAVRSTGIAEQGVIATMRLMAREMPRMISQWTTETLQGCAGVQVMTGGIGGMVIGQSVAEKLGVPFIETHLQPVDVAADTYPGVLLPWLPGWVGGHGFRLSHRLSDIGVWSAFKRPMAMARTQTLGLTGRQRANASSPVLYGFSRHVLDVPTQAGRARHVTGYWTLPAPRSWQPAPELEAFLARPGAPIVSIGFGSMASARPEAVTELVLGAVRQAGVRAVLLAGWGGLSSVANSEHVFCADAIPHDWLFARVAAAVHHGGAGTTGATLAAGIPALVVPFAADQPFWGARVAALRVGPPPIGRKRLTQERLAAALRAVVQDVGMRTRAGALGQLIRAEDGVSNAVEHFARI